MPNHDLAAERLFGRFVLPLVALLVGCVTPLGGPFEGVVTDAATGRPMEGVFVIAVTYIRGADMVGSRSFCTDLEVVRSDAQGRYKVTRGTAINADRVIMAYAPGFEDEFASSMGMRMVRFKGTDEQRKASFVTYSSLITCGPYNEVRGKILPLFKAMDEEDGKLNIDRRFKSRNPYTSKIEDLDALRESNRK